MPPKSIKFTKAAELLKAEYPHVAPYAKTGKAAFSFMEQYGFEWSDKRQCWLKREGFVSADGMQDGEPEGYMRPCERCNGKGAVEDGAYLLSYPACDGTGIYTPEDTADAPTSTEASAPTVAPDEGNAALAAYRASRHTPEQAASIKAAVTAHRERMDAPVDDEMMNVFEVELEDSDLPSLIIEDLSELKNYDDTLGLFLGDLSEQQYLTPGTKLTITVRQMTRAQFEALPDWWEV